MTRHLTTTAEAIAHPDADGCVWLVGKGVTLGAADGTFGSNGVIVTVPMSYPPVEFVQACAPCEMCHESQCDLDMCEDCGNEYEAPCPRHVGHGSALCDKGCCLDCRIELVGPCPNPDDWCPDMPNNNVTLGYAYPVGLPLPIVDAKSQQAGEVECVGVWRDPYPPTVHFPADLRKKGTPIDLAYYGPPETLVDKWALRVWMVTL